MLTIPIKQEWIDVIELKPEENRISNLRLKEDVIKCLKDLECEWTIISSDFDPMLRTFNPALEIMDDSKALIFKLTY
jgi:nicotinic acid phosphoribosyltransferase